MAKIENYLWPYDEVKVIQTETGLRYQAPWVTVNFPQPVKSGILQRYEAIRKHGPKSAADIQLVDTLLRPVAKYPVYFCLPDQNKSQDTLLNSYTQKNQTAETHWDVESLLSFTKAKDNGYDPISALSFFRYLHLTDLMTYLNSVTNRISLPDLEGSALEQGTLMFLRQNHYVTERCEEVLTPALKLHKNAEKKVSEFIKEEQGHDRLLAHSFKELGKEAKDIPVLDSLAKMMDLFKQAAQENLIAFCFIVDMFERSSDSNKNPMVLALLKMGQEKAAKPIQAHANINVHGDHDNESFEILNTLGLVPESYLVDALFWAQKASDQMILFLKERQTLLEKVKS